MALQPPTAEVGRLLRTQRNRGCRSGSLTDSQRPRRGDGRRAQIGGWKSTRTGSPRHRSAVLACREHDHTDLYLDAGTSTLTTIASSDEHSAVFAAADTADPATGPSSTTPSRAQPMSSAMALTVFLETENGTTPTSSSASPSWIVTATRCTSSASGGNANGPVARAGFARPGAPRPGPVHRGGRSRPAVPAAR